MEKQKTSIRLSPRAKMLLERLMKHWGMNQTATLEMLIINAARQEGIDKDEDNKKQSDHKPA